MSVRKVSESLKSSMAQRICMKHPQRLATHQLANKGTHNEAYYCEKCSIMLASQGYNVVKLSSISPIGVRKGSLSSRNSRGSNSRNSNSRNISILSNRKNEISTFIESLQTFNAQLMRKIQYIQDFLMKSQSQHGKMIEQANKFYRKIEEIIELQKYTTYNSILSKRSLDQSKARTAREAVIQAKQQIEAMIGDIRQNMDAVETVDYSIYNAIMGGYQVKSQKLKHVARQSLYLKPLEKYQILMPEIPKGIYSLSDKISILIKKQQSNTNSINASTKVHRVITEDQDVCMSDMSQSNSNGHESIIEQKKSEEDKNQRGKFEQPVFNAQQIMKKRPTNNKLAFSFDENSNNSNKSNKEVKINEDENILQNSNLMIIRGFEEGKLSKIEQRINSKEVCQSRQSLGQYLNFDTSRSHRNCNQDTQTLLIV